jgi:tetratricopeptide (TPR) repeat protein
MPATPRITSDRPSRSRALFTLEAQRLLAEGDYKEAIEICKRGLVYFPENHAGYMILAQAYHMLGENARAVNVIADGFRRTGSERLRRLYSKLSGETRAGETEAPLAPPVAEVTTEPVAIESTAIEPVAIESTATASEPHAEPGVEVPADNEVANIGEQVADDNAVAIDEPSVDNSTADINEPSVEDSTAAIDEPSAEDEVANIEKPVAGDDVASIDEPLREEDRIAMETDELPSAEETAGEHASKSAIMDAAENLVAIEEAAEDPIASVEALAEPIASVNAVAEAHDEVVIEQSAIDGAITEQAPGATETETAEPEARESERAIMDAAEHLVAIEQSDVVEASSATPVSTGVAEEVIASHPIEQDARHAPADDWKWQPEESFFIAVEDDHRHEAAAPVASEVTEEVPAPEPERIAIEEPRVEAPIIEQPIIEQPIIEQPIIEQPIIEQPIIEQPAATGPRILNVRGGQSGARGETSERARPLALALHAGKSISRLRSSNLRLIPGLEFAPLRHEDNLRRQSIAPLINEPMPQPEVRSRAAKKAIEETALPPLPSLGDATGIEEKLPAMRIAEEERPLEIAQKIEPPRTITLKPIQEPAPARPPELTPLEELARRLENARIPVVEEPEQRTAFEPSIVSDTLANILVAQGAFAEALKAFQTLARMKPERFDYYQGRIQEMKWRMQNPGQPWPPGGE